MSYQGRSRPPAAAATRGGADQLAAAPVGRIVGWRLWPRERLASPRVPFFRVSGFGFGLDLVRGLSTGGSRTVLRGFGVAPACTNAPACTFPFATMQSHGVRIARSHAYDWVALLLLIAMECVLNAIEPFHRFVGEGMIADLRYPLKSNTVPVWAVPVYDNITTAVICHGDASVIKEGHKSFPSGHSSWSFAGLGFLSWYLAGKITVFDRRGHVAKLCVVILPLLVAAVIAISRVDDYWHHWQDVFAGGILAMWPVEDIIDPDD
ncbi:Putative lipid phosphate phosphatase 3, chloroplastic [Triticum urartu]|uniref:Putative lipid phosphate phosphatase 3, chloroplastic n=1 Tax=Triticum urartu TaxID=4572 RepID=M7YNL4_TRIUA|nr:Putative lipid phosphate phosphatase 3, chloroplastic [Triticum urartu]